MAGKQRKSSGKRQGTPAARRTRARRPSSALPRDLASEARESNSPMPIRHDRPSSDQAVWAHLPVDPAAFYSAAADIDDLHPPADADSTPALRRLGQLPFPRGRFPLLGFLATVYEQAARHAREALASKEGRGG